MIPEHRLGKARHLSDDALLSAFDSATLREDLFGHPDHVRVAWLYLRRMDLAEALPRFSRALRRFATAHGNPSLYHETVTWGFLMLVNERMQTGRDGDTWAAFAARNPDLLQWRGGAFFEHWNPDVLTSEKARRFFVLPRGGVSCNEGAGSR